MVKGVMKMRVIPQIKQHLWALIFALGIVAPIFWMAIDRDPPYEITNGRVNPTMPTKGGWIRVTWDIKPLRSCRDSSYGTVTRKIIDSKGVVHTYAPVTSTYGTSAQFSEDAIKRNVQLPENITGRVRYSSIACYPCNPLQILWPICIETPTLEFDIADTNK